MKNVSIKRIFSLLVLYGWCAFSLFVFSWIIVSSLKTNNGFFSDIWGAVSDPQWGNYGKVWNNYQLGRYFLNSVVTVVSAVFLLLAIAAPAAYVLSRFTSRLIDSLSKFIILGLGIPYQLLLVPLFFQLFAFKLINTLQGLILVYIALSIPFAVFLLLGFFKTLPRSLEEAAYIDGCSSIRTFFKIMLPLARNGLVTCGVLTFIGLWNEFLLALTFISKDSKYTLSMGLNALQGSLQYTGDWVSLFAGFTVVVIPTFLVFVMLSKVIVGGLTMGAVKE